MGNGIPCASGARCATRPVGWIRFVGLQYLRQALGGQQAASSHHVRLLDVECGSWGKPDICGIPLHGRGPGLDRWRNGMRQRARRKTYAHLFRVKLRDGLPFRDNSFDGIVCREGVLHRSDAVEVFAEFRRVLEPHGTLWVCNTGASAPKISDFGVGDVPTETGHDGIRCTEIRPAAVCSAAS